MSLSYKCFSVGVSNCNTKKKHKTMKHEMFIAMLMLHARNWYIQHQKKKTTITKVNDTSFDQRKWNNQISKEALFIRSLGFKNRADKINLKKKKFCVSIT